MKSHNRKAGFSLIELLMVMSIIALLASIILAALVGAKGTAIAAQKVGTEQSVQTATEEYYNDNKAMPTYTCPTPPATGCTRVTPGSGGVPPTVVEKEDLPGQAATASGNAYLATMNALVNSHDLSSVPQTPDSYPYIYVDYGGNNGTGVTISSQTGTTPNSTTQTPITCLQPGSCNVGSDVECAYSPIGDNSKLSCSYELQNGILAGVGECTDYRPGGTMYDDPGPVCLVGYDNCSCISY